MKRRHIVLLLPLAVDQEGEWLPAGCVISCSLPGSCVIYSCKKTLRCPGSLLTVVIERVSGRHQNHKYQHSTLTSKEIHHEI